MTNLSIFERNVIHAFGGMNLTRDQTDDAEAMFLKHGADRKSEDDTLREIQSWARSNDMIPMAVKVYERQGLHVSEGAVSSLKAFQRDTGYRHRHPVRRATPWKHWREK